MRLSEANSAVNMFNNNSKTIDVSIRMLDKATIRGSLVQPQNATIDAILSKDTPFLEFISKDGQRKFIAKHQIAYVEPVEPLRKPVLKKPDDRFTDAFGMLGLKRTCSPAEAKAAYHAKAKLYHPDVYSGQTLPEEVARYMTDMFRQINTAFTEVRAELRDRQTAA